MAKRSRLGSRAAGLLSVLMLSACVGSTRTPETRETQSAEAPKGNNGAKELPISAIQGVGHQSPWLDHRVTTTGVVTAVLGRPSSFFVQSERSDDDPQTSEGLCILLEPRGITEPEPQGISESFTVGQRLRLTGRIIEPAPPGQLSVTCLELDAVEILAARAPLPAPVRMGRSGRPIPNRVIDDDKLQVFDPCCDGIDFFESLEGMRVAIPDALVVGPTSKYGEVTVVADGGVDAGPFSAAGGLLQTPDDANPERFVLSADAGPDLGSFDVGHRFARDSTIVGTVGYAFGIYRVMVTEPLPALASSETVPEESTSLVPSESRLTLGSFNLLNLSVRDSDEKFERLGRVIAEQMAGPDLLAVQEVQDDSGPEDDGTVTAEKTLARLIETIARLGGPRYAAVSLDPLNNQEGGRPGGNIRVGFLFNPDRLQHIDDPKRLDAPAFSSRTRDDWRDTRRPLLAQFRFGEHDFYAVGLHLRSKSRDDRAFGATQPPIRHSEPQRVEQAAAIRARLDEILERDPQANIVVLGDLNETSDRPPLTRLKASMKPERQLHDLMSKRPVDERYSFVFQGQAAQLDHILVNQPWAGLARIEPIRCCADKAADRQPGDHDPLVMAIELP